jgi:hypothetical protein
MVSIATSIDSVTTLNDGTEIPLFGLGTAWTENAESKKDKFEDTKKVIRSCIQMYQHYYRYIMADTKKGLGLLLLTPLSTIFQLYGSQFYWLRTQEYLGENH